MIPQWACFFEDELVGTVSVSAPNLDALVNGFIKDWLSGDVLNNNFEFVVERDGDKLVVVVEESTCLDNPHYAELYRQRPDAIEGAEEGDWVPIYTYELILRQVTYYG